jgi:hypothetical protein
MCDESKLCITEETKISPTPAVFLSSYSHLVLPACLGYDAMAAHSRIGKGRNSTSQEQTGCHGSGGIMEEGFRDHLKRRGRKDHVVRQLVDSVRLFENYLEKRNKQMHETTNQDLFDYAATCESERKGSARIKIRGLALYFGYIGNSEMAATADGIRESGISKHRHVFKLKDFLWVNQTHVSKLSAFGITDVHQMVESGRTPDAREKLAASTGIAAEDILELVKLSNLARLTGVNGIRARLYHDAGLDTWEKISLLDPHELIDVCVRFVEATSFPGVAPTPKEAAFTVSGARAVPRIVEW